jgi:membrane-associated protein
MACPGIPFSLAHHRPAAQGVLDGTSGAVPSFQGKGGTPVPEVQQLLANLTETHGYYVLFAGVMLENAGVPLPGETALLAAGFLSSSAGGGRLHLWAVVMVAFAAAVVGDNLGFWLGRKWARPRLTHGRRFLFLTPERFQQVEHYFKRYGSLTVFFGRFIALLRIAAGPSAGAAGMPWGRFFLANAAGAIVWASAIGSLGFAAGPAWQVMQEMLGWGAWAAAGLVVCAFVVWRCKHCLRRRRDRKLAIHSKSR